MISDWDDAYANGKYFAGADAWMQRRARESAAFRQDLLHAGRLQPNVAYGPGKRECFDLCLPAGQPRGLATFIHGGYWRSFCCQDWTHLARGALDRGWAMALIGYDLCPEVRISQIARQVAAGLAAVSAQVAGPLRLAGHSAGGHLAARVVCRDFPQVPRLKKVLCLSGLHDLRPMLRTRMNADFRMDLAEAEAESPALLTPQDGISVTAWVGGDERPEFIRQSHLLANVWTGCGVATRYVEEPGKNHFTLIDALEDAQSALMSEYLD